MGFSLMCACGWDVVLTFTSGPRLLAGLPLVVGLLLGLGSLFLIGLFMSYHGSLALHNYTTIEKHEKVSAPSTFKIAATEHDAPAVFTGRRLHPGFRAFVNATRPDRKGKDRPFVYFWMQWAYSPSPWSHGTLSNLVHYLGNGAAWFLPVTLGAQPWHPWSISLRPAARDAESSFSKKHDTPTMRGISVPAEPVGVTSASLEKREPLLDAAPIIAGRAL